MIPTTVAEAARRFGDRIAYVAESGWSISYEDIDHISGEIAAGLARSTSSRTAPSPSSARSPRA